MKTPSIISELGYTWVQLPRPDLLPLSILEKTKKGFFKRLFGAADSAEVLNADIFALFPKKTKKGVYPKVNSPKGVPSFKGHDILSGDSALKLSGLRQLGQSNAEAKFSKAKKLLYTFEQPQQLDTNVVLLEEYINLQKKTEPLSGFMEKLNQGNIFIITEVLQTKSFSIQDASDLDAGLSLSNEKLVEVSQTLKKDVDNQLTYESETPISFAIKASKILYNAEKGYYSLSRTTLKQVRNIQDLENSEPLGEDFINFEE
jgi:hypothetical protein